MRGVAYSVDTFFAALAVVSTRRFPSTFAFWAVFQEFLRKNVHRSLLIGNYKHAVAAMEEMDTLLKCST